MIHWSPSNLFTLKRNHKAFLFGKKITCLSKSLNSPASCTVCSEWRTFHYWVLPKWDRGGGTAICREYVREDVTDGLLCDVARWAACRIHHCNNSRPRCSHLYYSNFISYKINRSRLLDILYVIKTESSSLHVSYKNNKLPVTVQLWLRRKMKRLKDVKNST